MGRDCRGRCGRAPATRQGWSRQWQGTAGTGWESTRGRTPSVTGPWPVRRPVALPFPPGPLSLGSEEALLQPSFTLVQAKIEQRATNTFVTDLVFGEPSRRSRRSNHWDPHARASRTEFPIETSNQHQCETRRNHENTSLCDSNSRTPIHHPKIRVLLGLAHTQNHW